MTTKILSKDDIQKGSLLLVNAEHPVFDKEDRMLCQIDTTYPNIRLELKAASLLAHILNDLGCSGQILPVSGYRSQTEQEQIYSDSLSDNGLAFTTKYVALPGHSEHQTGLAIDLGHNPNFGIRTDTKKKIDFLCPDFPDEGICAIFRKHAPEYGYIQRYHQEKEAITGISHEPWHFRYVGWPHSEIMQNNGMALEEYIHFLKSYRLKKSSLKMKRQKQRIEIYYIPVLEIGGTSITFSDETIYEISGNNVDGCIITEWGYAI